MADQAFELYQQKKYPEAVALPEESLKLVEGLFGESSLMLQNSLTICPWLIRPRIGKPKHNQPKKIDHRY